VFLLTSIISSYHLSPVVLLEGNHNSLSYHTTGLLACSWWCYCSAVAMLYLYVISVFI